MATVCFQFFWGNWIYTATKTAERCKKFKQNTDLPLAKKEKSVYSLTARENAV
jgi:hypothetical protein